MKYYVCSNLNHGGEEFKRGDRVDLSDHDAKPLLDIGVISTDPVREPEAAAATEEAPAADAAKVGGQPAATGEPSIDGQAAEPARAEAEDVTPKVSERMTREELEAAAAGEGVDEAAVKAAGTKAELVGVIESHRAAKDGAPARADADPSADL